MRSFEEIIKDCLENRTTAKFNKYAEELCQNDKVKQMINNLAYDKRLIQYKDYLSIEDKIEECILLVLFKDKQDYISKFANFRFAVVSKIRDELKKEKNQLRYDQTDSFDNYSDSDCSIKLEDKIAANDKSIEENAEDNEKNDFRNELINIGIKIDTRPYKIMLYIYNVAIDNHFDSLHDLVILVNQKFQNEVKELLMYCGKKSKKIRKMFSSFFSFSTYEKFVEYMLKPNNKKLKISELIMDFNKIRNYLSVLFLDDNINDKTTFIEKCNWKKVSSYEKEIHRILSLFNSDKNIFELKNELKNYSPNKLSKIYEIHTVPNLVANFLILDVLQQYAGSGNEIKLAKIVEILFPDNYQDANENAKNNFRKYTLLPRLKEMEEYGFIKINNDKYLLNAKFLDNNQKLVLKKVVPFFCGLYPFSSIGHFLANRLDIDDKFLIEPYNISNILDDCITYNLLKAINNKETIHLVFKGENTIHEIQPKELFIENNKSGLLKFKDNTQEYYLNKIEGFVNKTNKSAKTCNIDSPIFSEIYSFYYKIFEDSIKEYNKNKMIRSQEALIKKDFTMFIPKKYNLYDYILNKRIFNELFPILAQLKNISIPLTILEQRWLKTIMQDERFDLFVSNEEKQLLENLIKDIEPFDLSCFKIYDNKDKKYKSVIHNSIPNGLNKDLFRQQLKYLDSASFSIQENSFKDLSYKNS